jgi:hypothetical protein
LSAGKKFNKIFLLYQWKIYNFRVKLNSYAPVPKPIYNFTSIRNFCAFAAGCRESGDFALQNRDQPVKRRKPGFPLQSFLPPCGKKGFPLQSRLHGRPAPLRPTGFSGLGITSIIKKSIYISAGEENHGRHGQKRRI